MRVFVSRSKTKYRESNSPRESVVFGRSVRLKLMGGKPAEHSTIKFLARCILCAAMTRFGHLPERDLSRAIFIYPFGLCQGDIGVCQSMYEENGHLISDD